MKYRVPFIAGAAVGYVLGTKAGRERYEQIRRTSRRVAENPAVQEAAGVIRAKGGELAGAAKGKAGDLVDKAPDMVKERIPGRTPQEYRDPRRESV
ncbi:MULTISPECIES: YtxH domain-containing protein [Actinomadura]|uniref:YtxH domain-containing protein n=1 Tax=Actinomadura yumaensis TaxID=111807 RepID=A0ABW2CJR6_9ACTN|nr:YtxH domain-containing protein [Actinomadura sp. J1-007]MWK33042.1 YtxH domain-containing protein [Actinomadura sp. J1-007]